MLSFNFETRISSRERMEDVTFGITLNPLLPPQVNGEPIINNNVAYRLVTPLTLFTL